MFVSIKRGARLAAVVGLSAFVVVVGSAAPAFAAPPPGTNQGIGLAADGLVDVGPLAQANFPGGPTTDTVVSVTSPGLLSSGTINATAGATTATASVEDLAVRLSALATLNATAVSSECSYDSTTAVLSGSASLTDAEVTLLGPLPDISLAASPGPNTGISVPGVAEIVLNRQVSNPDGSLTVDAIFIDLLGSTQTVTVATSSCQPAVLVVPVIAPQFAAGAGAVGLLALGFFLYRRRQSSSVASV